MSKDLNELFTMALNFIREHPGINVDTFDAALLPEGCLDTEDLSESILALIEYQTNDYSNIENVISYLLQSKREYVAKQVFCMILAKFNGAFPYELLLLINDQSTFWKIIHYIEPAIPLCSIPSAEIILEINKHVFEFVKNDYLFGSIMIHINWALKQDTKLCIEVIQIYFETPKSEWLQIALISFEQLLIHCKPTAVSLFEEALSSSTSELLSFSCKVAAFIDKNEKMPFGLFAINRIIEKCNNGNDQVTADLASLLFKAINALPEDSSVLSEYEFVLHQLIKKSDLSKYYICILIIQEEDQNKKDMSSIYDILFNTKIGENIGLINELDMIACQLIKERQLSLVYDLLRLFAKANWPSKDNKSIDEYFNSTWYAFGPPEINEIINRINQDMQVEGFSRNLALRFYYKMADYEDLTLFEMLNGINSNNVLRSIGILATECFSPRLVCFCSIKFLEITMNKEQFEEYYHFCLKSIALNYRFTIVEIMGVYICCNDVQREMCARLTSALKKIQDVQSTSYALPDLKPSNIRLQKYAIAARSITEKINENVKQTSVILHLCTNKTFKYGKRYAVVYEDNGQRVIQESEYNEYSHSVELPFVYINDPFRHYVDKMQLVEEEIDETGC